MIFVCLLVMYIVDEEEIIWSCFVVLVIEFCFCLNYFGSDFEMLIWDDLG